jgi:hypothetical protein
VRKNILRRESYLLWIIWLVSAVYLARYLNHCWFPYDEGTLGQAAERVLNGEMPNRDFIDPYTGGLAYLDAAIFKIFGINLLWLRIFLFVVFLAWIPAVFALAREFCGPWAAAGVTLVTVSWSVPNYPAAMPSWFSLFLATFGTLCLARYIRQPQPKWLILAGLCGGVSFLFKSVAVYYVAAALAFFVYREQDLARNQDGAPRKTLAYLAFLGTGLSLFVLGLIRLVFSIAGPLEYLHFVLPGAAIALLLIYRERTPANLSSLSRIRVLARMGLPFLVAFALPVFAYFAFYWHAGGLQKLLFSVFAAPMSRMIYARFSPIPLVLELSPLLAVLLFLEAVRLTGKPRLAFSIFLALFVAFLLVGSNHNLLLYAAGVASGQGSLPVLVPFAAYCLFRADGSSDENQLLALLLSMAALFSLIQFPFAHVIYFGYTALFVILLAGNLIARIRPSPKLISIVACVGYILFGAFILRPHYLIFRGHLDYDSTRFTISGSGPFWVAQDDKRTYETLIPFVQTLAADGSLLAGPDCPEVYFLANLKNRTTALFDFLQDRQAYRREMQNLLTGSDPPRVVVLNNRPQFSTEEFFILHELIAHRFEHSRSIGDFTVYW